MSDVDGPSVPTRGVLIGLDYGSKRVGVAVCDSGQSIASPLQVLQQQPGIEKQLKRIADEYAAVGLVVGLPVHMSGDEGEKAEEARKFGGQIATATMLPIVFHDERFTSKMANSAMIGAGLSKQKRKAKIDMLAAQFMLQAYLDSPRNNNGPASLND